MDFTFKIFAQPLLALVPMALIFVAYFSQQKFPLGLPGGLVAIIIGTVSGWWLGVMDEKLPVTSASLALPAFSGGSLWAALTDRAVLNYLSVIFPMGVFNVSAPCRTSRVRRLPGIASALSLRSWPTASVQFLPRCLAAYFRRRFTSAIRVGNSWARVRVIPRSTASSSPFFADRHHTSCARIHSAGGRHRHSPLYRYYYRGAVFPGDSAGARARRGARNGTGARRLGSPDARKRFTRGWNVGFQVGLARFNQESFAIHGMISLERGFIFTSMILSAMGVALIGAQVRARRCVVGGGRAAVDVRHYSCL